MEAGAELDTCDKYGRNAVHLAAIACRGDTLAGLITRVPGNVVDVYGRCRPDCLQTVFLCAFCVSAHPLRGEGRARGGS